jgi:protein TonB
MAPGSAPAPAAATGADTASLRGRVAHYLSLRLGEQFRYPPSARRRGWEGRVLLAFRIEPDGRIDGVRVLDSSGYPVLDDSAAQALRGLGQLAAVVPWLNGSALDLTLPVIYRLEQG